MSQTGPAYYVDASGNLLPVDSAPGSSTYRNPTWAEILVRAGNLSGRPVSIEDMMRDTYTPTRPVVQPGPLGASIEAAGQSASNAAGYILSAIKWVVIGMIVYLGLRLTGIFEPVIAAGRRAKRA